MEYDILDDKAVNVGNLSLNNEGVNYLKNSRGWAMFIGIVGIIGAGFMLIMAIVMFVLGSAMSRETGMPGAVLGLIYLVMAGVNVAPIVFIMKFAQSAKKACQQFDNGAFNMAIKNLRGMFKSTGIVIISVIGLYIIAIIGFVIFGINSLI